MATPSKAALRATENRLRRELADAEATVSDISIKLAGVVAQLGGESVPVSGIDALWKVALPTARTRSSKHKCRKAWNLIPKAQRPEIETMINALKVWNRCPEWKRDGNQFVPALDKWIKERRWEDLPEVSEAPSRARTLPKVIVQSDPSEAVTDREEIASLLRMRS